MQLKSLPHMFCLSFSFWNIYKQGVLFYILIFKNMGIWDEPIKKASIKIIYKYSCTYA